MRILLIGGTGTISSAITALISKRIASGESKDELWVLNRGNRAACLPSGVRQIVADAYDKESLSKAIDGLQFDVVCYFIGFELNQVIVAHDVFAGKIKQFVYISSASAYQKPPASYLITESTQLENPFWEDITIPQESTAVVSLIRLLWKEMRDQVANIPHNFCLSPRDRSVAEIMEMTGRAFVTDAFHSLGLSGYCVTKEMAEKAPGGGEEDDEDPSREPDRDEVTAQAYHDAYQKARKDIIDSLTGGDEPAALINRIEGWHTAMQLHLWVMGVRKGGESSGFRKEEITVQESMYIPVEPVAIPEAMKVLSQLLVSEKSAFVRAVLGHFFIAYIHPFTDNNGVIARLFMNSQLVAGGYPWSVIPGWKADLYNDALEKACTTGGIYDLANLVAESIYRKDITVDSEEKED